VSRRSQPAAEFTLRDQRSADFETLWQLDQECFPPDLAYSRTELAGYIRRQSSLTVVAEREGKIAGYIVAERGGRKVGHIITLDVRAQARRSGLGSKLMAAAEERLRALGCASVLLEVAVDNTAAIAFYHRQGYATLATIPRYYTDQTDALLLGKKLTQETP
jgi:ribosomal protein S18 acetylase RimI-like enzyme